MPEQVHAPPELVAYLEGHGVPHNIVVPEVPLPPSVKAAAKVIGTEPTAMVRSLVLQAADGAFILVIVGGTAKVDPKKLAVATGKVGWTLASPAVVREVTGYTAGSVPPVGPGYGERFPVLIDLTVMKQPVVFGDGGHKAVLLCLLPRDIQRLTGAEIHDLIV